MKKLEQLKIILDYQPISLPNWKTNSELHVLRMNNSREKFLKVAAVAKRQLLS